MNLNSKIEEIFPRLPDSRKKALKKIGLKTVEDLLYYFPARYGDTEETKNTKNVKKGDKIIIYAKVKKIKPTKAYYKKITMTEAVLEEILKKYNLPKLKTALIWIHSPKKQSDALSARKRFSFEEIFFIQVLRKKQKTKKEVDEFVSRFPFKPTVSQKKSIEQILNDFKSGQVMSRLLEGDVGSGKTVVAATTAYSVVTTKPKGENVGNLQVAYMAPTEILAKQLFESFIQYFSHLPINIGLITSSGCKKFPSKIDRTKWT